MNFVLYKVGQFQHIFVAHCNGVIERLTSTAIEELYFTSHWKTCKFQVFSDVFLSCAVKDWCSDFKAECIGGPTQVCLHDLTDIHAVWHTQWVENDINRCAIREEGHVLNRQHA